MPSKKDMALMSMAEKLVRRGEPDRAEQAMRSIEDDDFRDHGLMCLAIDIASASTRVDDRRYAKRLLKDARRIARSLDRSFRKNEAMAYVEAAEEM